VNPAFSLVFFTTLTGASQGLFLALYALQWAGTLAGALAVAGGLLALGLGLAGLVASFFHLGRPAIGWRAVSMWRTSWLSREVILLPLYLGGVALWTLLQWRGAGPLAAVGALTALAAGMLFLCTGMVYAAIRFVQEWAHPLTVLNLALMGCASGLVLASALAAALAPALAPALAAWALGSTLAAATGRLASLRRNARLKPRSSLQSAIGVRAAKITQRSMGFGGGSFNTREFFHGRSPGTLRAVKGWFLLLAFALPMGLLAAAPATLPWLAVAFGVQYLGLVAERWFFFAQANHPQNLYYQTVS
jgi:DMSO reductase anchor subunit